MLVVELGQRERAVGDDVLRAVPVLPELLAAVPRPGEGPRRGEDVGEEAARLAQGDLERAVVECLGGLDVLHEERGPGLQLAHPHPGEGEVVRGQRLAVAPAHALAQAEEVREPVARDAHVVRHRREDVQLGVDHEQALEELLGDLQALGRVDVAGDDGVGLRDRGREVLGRREPQLLVDPARERLVVHLLGALEVEREVVGERHLEERVACAALVAERARKLRAFR